METLIDSNNNGVPDIFEHRRPISDILNDDEPRSTVTVEIETRLRVPRKGELFLCGSMIYKQEYDLLETDRKWPIVRVISGNYQDIEKMNFDDITT
jgi:hypothetical protein